jgi:hypothetical protein
MKTKFALGCTAVVLILVLATSAWAEPKTDSFWIELTADNMVAGGGGSGWHETAGSGQWIYYDDTGWWNQWFYDDPPDPTRHKVISYDIILQPMQDGSMVSVALNWSNMLFPQTGPIGPPPYPDQEECIERQVIFSGEISDVQPVTGGFVIPDYNPEWVSIDIQYYNQGMNEPMLYASGTITHECVPEPSTVVLLGIGAIGLLVYGWRRRRS